MRILAIETSCDETALAILDIAGDFPNLTLRVLANNTLTQIEMHKQYGGVFPMLAKREHARTLVPLLVRTLDSAKLYAKTSRHVIESPLRPEFQEIFEREPELFAQFIDVLPNINPPEIDAIAVTQGPGLEPALWVGLNFAKALSMIWKVPVIPVNHMEGHLLAPLINRFIPSKNGNGDIAEISHGETFPAIGLLVSGGHTEIVLMKGFGEYEIIGETKDDAVGEAFDKVARILGLPYPGGPEISRLGESGTPGRYALPRPMLHSKDYSFSFAGLKTAVLYLVKGLGTLSDEQKTDIAREFEEASIEVLTKKTLRAVEEFGAKTVILGGGVSANKRLRKTLREMIDAYDLSVTLYLPDHEDHELSTDNALMIAIAAYFGHASKNPNELRAKGNWKLSAS